MDNYINAVICITCFFVLLAVFALTLELNRLLDIVGFLVDNISQIQG